MFYILLSVIMRNRHYLSPKLFCEILKSFISLGGFKNSLKVIFISDVLKTKDYYIFIT